MLPFCGAVFNVKETPSLDVISVPNRCKIPLRYTNNLLVTNVFDGEKITLEPSTSVVRSSCKRGIGADPKTCE